MKNADPKSIVADGGERLRQAMKWREMRARIRIEVRARHAAELAGASRWRCWWLALKCEREVAAEMAKRFPPHALHLAGL